MVLSFDFGIYSSPLNEAEEPKYSIVHEPIDGYPAKVVSPRKPGHGVTGIYINNLGHSYALCLWGQDLTAEQQALALKIFRTIQFGKRHAPSSPKS